jgi:hypothetical protein
MVHQAAGAPWWLMTRCTNFDAPKRRRKKGTDRFGNQEMNEREGRATTLVYNMKNMFDEIMFERRNSKVHQTKVKQTFHPGLRSKGIKE